VKALFLTRSWLAAMQRDAPVNRLFSCSFFFLFFFFFFVLFCRAFCFFGFCFESIPLVCNVYMHDSCFQNDFFFFFSYVVIEGSVPVDETTKQLDAQLKEARTQMAKEIKLLLLGAGESGKSTIAKQMKILHLNGFTKAELMGFKPVLHSNAIEIIQTLVRGCDELGIAKEPNNQALFNKIDELSSIETPVDQALAADLKVCAKACCLKRLTRKS
jgi:hypothetical protein